MADDSTRDDADGGEERPRPQRPARPAGFGRPEDRPGRAGRPGWDRDRGPRGDDRGGRGPRHGDRGGSGGREEGRRGELGGRGRGGDGPDGRGGPRPEHPGGGFRGREERGGRDAGFRGREDRDGGYRGREDRGPGGGGYRGRDGGGYRPRDREDRGGPGGARDGRPGAREGGGGFRGREDRGGAQRGGADRGGFRGGERGREDRGGFRGRDDRGGGFRGREDRDGGYRGRDDRGGGYRGRDDRGGGFRGRDDRGRAPAPPAVPLISTDEDAEALADEVLDPRRTRPVVCLTTRVGEDRPALDARRIKEAIGRRCELRAVRTGNATRTLAERLPPQHGVFGGAARIWWPGVGELDSRDHPLILDRQGVYGPRALENTLVAFDEGPPAGARPRPAVVHEEATAPGTADVEVDGGAPDPSVVPAAATTAGADAELAAARAEVARLRERLAEVRLDAVSGAPAPQAAPTPRLASEERLGHAAIPEAVLREPDRLRHLELVAAWLLLDGDGVRRERPLGHVALGEGYAAAIAAHEQHVPPAEVAAVAARAVGGRPGDASELDVRSEVDPTDDPIARGDGAALWSCAIGGTEVRLRWWTRPDGAVELADLAEPGAAPPSA